MTLADLLALYTAPPDSQQYMVDSQQVRTLCVHFYNAALDAAAEECEPFKSKTYVTAGEVIQQRIIALKGKV